MCYTGEVGRSFVTRLHEHKNDVDTITTTSFTRETRKLLPNVEYYVDRHNYVIDWEGGKVEDRETNRCARWIKEATWIRKT